MRRIGDVALLTAVTLLLVGCDASGADTERVPTVQLVADDLFFEGVPARSRCRAWRRARC